MSSVLNISEKIKLLLKVSGYQLVQINGQRRFGPPPNWSGSPPSRGCEIFIGKLPRDCYEDEIIPSFEKIGRIYEMRLMVDFNNYNRGYAFLRYTTVEDANRAVTLMDNCEIRPGNFIGVSKSVDNCRLFVGGVNITKTADEVREELSKYVVGITSVIMYPSINDKNRNRGFVFVEFKSHKMAAMAKRQLAHNWVLLWENPIIVDWAEPEPEIDPRIMKKVRILYFRNLNPETTEELLYFYINYYTSAANISRVKKINDFAFVHFRTRGSAEFILLKLNGTIFNGNQITVEWARPQMFAKSRISLPSKMYLCQSLPPRLRHGNNSRNKRIMPEIEESNESSNFFTSAFSEYNGAPPVLQPLNVVYNPAGYFQSPILLYGGMFLTNVFQQRSFLTYHAITASTTTFYQLTFTSNTMQIMPFNLPTSEPAGMFM